MKFRATTLGEISGGGSYGLGASASMDFTGPKFLRTTDIVSGAIDWSKVPYCSADSATIARYKLFPEDIVISRTGANAGINCLVLEPPENAIFAGYLVRFQINRELADAKYVSYLLRSKAWQEYVEVTQTGSAQPQFNAVLMGQFPIALPSLRTQKAVSSFLGALDAKIAANKVLSKTLEAIAQTIFKSWFIDFDPVKAKMAGEKPAGMDAATAALFPDSMVESEFGLIPKGWGVCPASELFEVGIGRTPPRKEPKWFCKGTEGIPWVSIRDMGTYETYSHGTNEGLTQAAVEKFKVPLVPENTVLMSFKLTVGKLCISDANLVTNEAIAHFRISEDSPLDTFYTYLWLSNLDMGSLDSTSSIGTATNSGVIKQIKFLVPPRELLGNFHDKVSPIFSQLKLLRKQTTNLVLLRDSLLPRLISGELQIPEEMLAS